MQKGFNPPAPVGNAPSQIVNCNGGPKLTAAATKKKDNLVKHPSHFSSSSSLHLQHHFSLKVPFFNNYS